MNYKEVRIVKELIDELQDMDMLLKDIQKLENYLKITSGYNTIWLRGKRKEKVMNTIKEVRDEMISELKEYGVTEE